MTPQLFKQTRLNAKLTQAQFAERIGQGITSIEKKEQGVRTITKQDIMLIEIIFKKELAKAKRH